jgi:16S rRNA (uracil1498-N3)-methyltransferase
VTIPAVLRSSAAHVFVDSLGDPVLADGDLHHLARVLRVRDDDVVTVSDGAGRWRTARLRGDRLDADGPIVEVPARVRATIATAVPKGDRLEWMVQKLTELGVGRIVLVDCARSVVRWNAERAAKQIDRLRRVAREAAMQSRQVWLPVVDGPVPFAAAVLGDGVALADPDGRPAGEAAPWQTIIVGPEGGLTEAERGYHIPMVAFSEHILRVETAAVAAAAVFGSVSS